MPKYQIDATEIAHFNMIVEAKSIGEAKDEFLRTCSLINIDSQEFEEINIKLIKDK